LQINPEKIEFHYTEKGKPYLAKTNNHLQLHFNVSHSEDYIIYGISKNLIGVDLEYINHKTNCQELAKRFFCPNEHEIISNLPKCDKYRAFYLAWTSKEAYLKAIGTGLSGGLDSIEVDLLLQENKAKIAKINHKNYSKKDWYLYNWVYPENFIASLAVFSQKSVEIKYYQL